MIAGDGWGGPSSADSNHPRLAWANAWRLDASPRFEAPKTLASTNERSK
jgi:hypothetical protein